MADSDFIVTISGAALSLLFYENVRNCGDQMGFLLGETLEFALKTYTDADNQVETVKTLNNVETVVTCPLPHLLHDSIGRINKEKLKDFLRDKSKQVIGWFRFRRNTELTPTMRDRILHKQFAAHFSDGNSFRERFFVTCLLSATISAERGTHKFKHVFLRCTRAAFEPVSLKISNLGQDSFVCEDSDYKPTPTKRIPDLPDVITKLIESSDLDLSRMNDLQSTITIQKTAEHYLNQLIADFCKSDLEVAELEKQVKEFKFNQKTEINDSSNNVDHEIKTSRPAKEEKGSEQISPLRKEFNDNRIFQNHSVATSQTIAAHKLKPAVVVIEKNIEQGNIRKIHTDATGNQSQEPPSINSVSETIVDVTETVPNKSGHTNMSSEIVKELIYKNETSIGSVGRGRGKILLEVLEQRKAAKAPGPVATRSERTFHIQVSQQESSEANSVRNITSGSPDNGGTKKKNK